MTEAYAATTKIAELRNAFDDSFAIAPASPNGEQIETLLAIRVAGDSYALKIGEISGLANNRKIVLLPSPLLELLGVAGIRGEFVPVYSLAALLGYGRDVDQTRWLVLCGLEDPVGLAFSDFEGYFQVSGTQIHSSKQEGLAHAHIEHVVRTVDGVRSVVSIPPIIEMIQKRCETNRVSKER